MEIVTWKNMTNISTLVLKNNKINIRHGSYAKSVTLMSEIIKLLQQVLIVVIADSNLPCQKNWKFLGPSELREFSLLTKREEGTG